MVEIDVSTTLSENRPIRSLWTIFIVFSCDGKQCRNAPPNLSTLFKVQIFLLWFFFLYFFMHGKRIQRAKYFSTVNVSVCSLFERNFPVEIKLPFVNRWSILCIVPFISTVNFLLSVMCFTRFIPSKTKSAFARGVTSFSLWTSVKKGQPEIFNYGAFLCTKIFVTRDF